MQATFPHRLLWQAVQFWPVGMSLDAQESISGAETVVQTMRGRWMASATFVLRGEAATLEWQWFLAQMEGRVGTTLVPARSRFRPKDRDGHALSFCQIGDIAGAQTMEHWGLANAEVAHVRLSASAPLRATQIDVALVNSTGLRPGQFIGIEDRLHRVQAVWQVGSSGQRAMIQPPLRAAAPVNTRVIVDRPVCRMRMVSEAEGVFDQELDRMPSVTVNFQEAV